MTETSQNDKNAQPALAVRSPFAENLFLIDTKTGHKFVNIAKCGVTTIKQVIAEHEDISYESVHDLHKVFGMRADNKLSVRVANDLRGDDFVRVAVWRDPVDRFMSWYRDKVLKPKQPYVFSLGLPVQHDEERLLEVVRFELNKQDPEWMDEHLRPQAEYYRPEDVDVVVMLEDLNDYLKSIGAAKTKPKQYNVTKKEADTDLSSWLKGKIKSAYGADYRLKKDVRPKIWVP